MIPSPSKSCCSASRSGLLTATFLLPLPSVVIEWYVWPTVFFKAAGSLNEPTAQSALVTPQDTLSAFAGLSRLSFLLQSRQFAAFWTLLRSDSLSILQPFVAEVADFDDLIRASVGNSVEGCFRSIGRRRLETYLGMEVEDRDLDDWLDQRGWTSDGDKVVIPPNAENSPVASVIRERTSLDGAHPPFVGSLPNEPDAGLQTFKKSWSSRLHEFTRMVSRLALMGFPVQHPTLFF